MIDKHQQIVEKLRSLPPERIDEVIDFIDFIDGCEKRKAGVTFDEWAMNLAKKKRVPSFNGRGYYRNRKTVPIRSISCVLLLTQTF